MLVLGIETTCDETACAVVKDGHEILSNVLSSQIEEHKRYGGVYPELASRLHVDRLIPMIDLAIKKAHIKKEDLDLIAVSYTPGLIGAITIGLNGAKALASALDIPFIGVHHIEAHLYASMMNQTQPIYPSIGVVVSGGHTLLLKISSIGNYEIISQTVDDAIGEAFDKVARMLDLPYPGGPYIEQLALKGDASKYPFKAGFVKKNPLAFSFSGLKTNVLYTIFSPNIKQSQANNLSNQEKADIAASFQHCALNDVVTKAYKACSLTGAKAIYTGGGVTQSQYLKKLFIEKNSTNLPLFFPEKGLSLDNGAMIAGLGYHKFLKQKGSSPLDLKAIPRSPL